MGHSKILVGIDIKTLFDKVFQKVIKFEVPERLDKK